MNKLFLLAAVLAATVVLTSCSMGLKHNGEIEGYVRTAKLNVTE